MVGGGDSYGKTSSEIPVPIKSGWIVVIKWTVAGEMVGQPQVERADGDVDPGHDKGRRTVSEQSSRSFLSGVRAHNPDTLYGKNH